MPENAHSQSAMFEDTIAVAEFPENPTEFPTKVPTMMTGHSTSSSSSATHRAPFNPLINHNFPSKNWPCYRDIPLKKTCLSLNMFNHVYL